MRNVPETLRNHAMRVPVIQRSLTARQLVKFGVVGATNTFWDYLTYIALTRGWFGHEFHFLTANLAAFFVSVVNSYILNKRWTFRFEDARHHVFFTKFFAVNLVTLTFYELLMYIFVHHYGLFDLYGKTISIVIVIVWNFLANKYWTFRKPPLSEPA